MDNNMSPVLASIPPEVQKELFQFVSQLTAQPTNEIGALLTDTVRYWRFKNQLKILEKAKNDLQRAGVNPKQVPIKFIVPFLEGCSLEEDKSMQDKWSALLYNASNPQNRNQILPSYIDILKQLSSLEAKILDVLYDTYEEDEFSLQDLYKYKYIIDRCNYLNNIDLDESSYKHFYRLKDLNLEHIEISIYINNFIRLRLLKSNFSETLYEILNSEREDLSYQYNRYNNNNIYNDFNNKLSYMEKNKVQFTPMGIDFIKVCRDK